jgi:hypothetical protein
LSKKNEDRSLAPAELRAARTALAAARGRKRLDVILDVKDPQALIRALPADELYLIIRDVGLGDAATLVQLASAAQFKIFLDLEAWSGDTFDPRKTLPWLRAARAGAHLEPKAEKRWARKLSTLDPEVLFLVLRTTLRVHDLEADPDPELTSTHTMRTPEGKYALEFLVEGMEYAAVRGLLDDLFAEDPFRTTRLLASLAWESPIELEETALRWRAGRLGDLGFPSREEALSWFARPPRSSGRDPGPPGRPPGFFLATLARGSLLDRALAGLSAEEQDAVEPEIVAAANAVLVADAVDPGDVDAVRSAFESARAYVELGLEQLAGSDDRRAAETLATTPVKRIFQQGFGRVLALSWRAQKLRARAGADTRLGSPLDELVAALAGKRPRYFPGIEAPRTEWGTVAAAAYEPRHFRTSEELTRTAAALDEIEARLSAS